MCDKQDSYRINEDPFVSTPRPSRNQALQLRRPRLYPCHELPDPGEALLIYILPIWDLGLVHL